MLTARVHLTSTEPTHTSPSEPGMKIKKSLLVLKRVISVSVSKHLWVLHLHIIWKTTEIQFEFVKVKQLHGIMLVLITNINLWKTQYLFFHSQTGRFQQHRITHYSTVAHRMMSFVSFSLTVFRLHYNVARANAKSEHILGQIQIQSLRKHLKMVLSIVSTFSL